MCIECNDIYDNCPVCKSYPWHREQCEECKGEGKIYFNDCGDIMLLENWIKLPADEKMWDHCTACEGVGEIIVSG